MRTIVRAILVAAAVLVAALLLAHGRASTTTSDVSTGGVERIAISNFAYSPASVTVKVGTVVVFTNEDSVEHTATSNAEGVFDSGTLDKGQSIRLKMTKVGSFSYHCSFHAFMHGTIKVVS